MNMGKLQVKIGGMSCSFCAATIEKAFSRMEGVGEVHVSLAHEEALIKYDPEKRAPTELKDTLRSLGYAVRDPDKVKAFEEQQDELRRGRRRLVLAGLFTLAALGFMVAMWLGFKQPWFRWPMLILALGTMFGPGWHIKQMAFQSLRRGILNQHVLLEFGAFAGLIGGLLGFINPQFPMAGFFAVSVFITTYHILSGYASLLVRTRASQAVQKLLSLQPPTARVIRDGHEEELPVEQVQVGDLVRARPGEGIPVDGVVVEGFSAVDESLVTGESIPVEKTEGDEVIGGSLNQSGTLVVEVTKVGQESFLQRVARHIEEARALKPGVMQLVDVVLKYYVPGVVVIGGLALLIWTLGAWAVTGQVNVTRAIFAALAVFVMGYPCALGMATPLAMIRGGGMAAERGILIRSGEAFQIFPQVRKIVLDKTGTVTRGEPTIVEVVPAEEFTEDELLKTAAAAESASEHPLARAIVRAAQVRNLKFPEAQGFQSHTGKGVEATVEGGHVLAGKPTFLREQGISIEGEAELPERLKSLEEQGRTVVGVAREGHVIGLVAIADTLKPDAKEAIQRMRQAGMEPVMITGDNERTARAVAGEVGIEEILAEVLPEEKANQVRELQRGGYRVAMVGDGINDAPALMQADVGIAIGAGTDIAIESSDIILIGDRLSGILDAHYIAKSSYRKTMQNLTLAFSFNGIGVPAAATGLVHPVWAMVAMAASVSAVLFNSFGGKLLPIPRRKEGEQMEMITLNVPTIHCEGCVQTIREALTRRDGVHKVEGDPRERRVTVTYQRGKIKLEEIRTTIVEAGFAVG